eukprot:scaffold24189_cov100-Isochrysis_galbana.AAC.4
MSGRRHHPVGCPRSFDIAGRDSLSVAAIIGALADCAGAGLEATTRTNDQCMANGGGRYPYQNAKS